MRLGRHEVVPHRHRHRQVDQQHGGRPGQGLGLHHFEVLGQQAHRDARATTPHRVVHGGGEVEVQRVAVLIGLGRLLPVVARTDRGLAVIADAVLVELAEEIGERLLSEPAHPAGVSSVRPPCCSMRPCVGQRLGQLGQPVQGPRRVLAHVRPHLVQVDLAQGRRVRGGLEEVLHAVELTQLRGQVGGPREAHRPLALEPVGATPAGLGHGQLQVAGPAAPPATADPCPRAPLPSGPGAGPAVRATSNSTPPGPPPCARPAGPATRRGSGDRPGTCRRTAP